MLGVRESGGRKHVFFLFLNFLSLKKMFIFPLKSHEVPRGEKLGEKISALGGDIGIFY